MKRETKAGNTVVNRRLTGLALITGMVLLFSSGISVAASDFKLFHPVEGKVVELAKFDKEKDKEDLGKMTVWLKGQAVPDMDKFVKQLSNEPFKFSQVVKAALSEIKGPSEEQKSADKDALKKSINEAIERGIKSSRNKLAMKDLVTALFDAKDLSKEEWLKEIFSDELIADLALLKEEPKVVADADKTPTPTPDADPSKDKSLLDQIVDIKDAFLKKLAEKPVATDTKADETTKKATDVGGLPNTGGVAGAQPQGGARAVGEQNNAGLEKLVTQICDIKAAQDAAFAESGRKLLAQADALNANLTAAAIGQQQQVKQNDGLKDAAAAITAALSDNGKQQNQVSAPPPVTPPQPQQANNRKNDDNTPLPVPTPEQPQQQQQAQAAPFQLPYTADNTPIRVATGRLPFSDAINELDRAESVAASLEGREPYTKRIAAMGPNVSSAVLVEPISKLDADIQRASTALRVANDKAKTLERNLERVKEGGRKALSETDLKKEKQFAQEYQEKKEAFEQEKQMIQSQVQQISQQGGDASGYSQQANQYLQGKAQEMQAAKKRKDTFDGELELKVESLNGEIKTLASQRDDLKTAAADLEGKLASLKSEQSSLTQMYTTALTREMSGLANAAGTAAQTFGNNAAKIFGYGGANRGAAQVPGKLQTGRAPTAGTSPLTTGTAGRGLIGSKNGI